MSQPTDTQTNEQAVRAELAGLIRQGLVEKIINADGQTGYRLTYRGERLLKTLYAEGQL